MAIKSIFVPFFEDKSAKTAFRAAVELAKKDKAHIFALHMRSRPMPPTNVYFPLGGGPADFTEDLQKAEDALVADLKTVFAKVCDEKNVGLASPEQSRGGRGVTASWSEAAGYPLIDYGRRATACDLSVVAAAGDDASAMERDIIESLLFQSGRPVLLCPEAGLSGMPKKVVVAWNGREEAARAVGASLDLLQEADAVTVISVRRADEPVVNTDDIGAYLRLHDVNAAVAAFEVTDAKDPAVRLDAEIREENPDLLVMGAYSHSRWREAVLGGFTRHMIKEAKLPVLMAR